MEASVGNCWKARENRLGRSDLESDWLDGKHLFLIGLSKVMSNTLSVNQQPKQFNIEGATSRYSELFYGSLKIVVNWKETYK